MSVTAVKCMHTWLKLFALWSNVVRRLTVLKEKILDSCSSIITRIWNGHAQSPSRPAYTQPRLLVASTYYSVSRDIDIFLFIVTFSTAYLVLKILTLKEASPSIPVRLENRRNIQLTDAKFETETSEFRESVRY